MKKVTETIKFLDNCIFKLNNLKKKGKKIKTNKLTHFNKKETAMKVWSRRSTIEPYLVDCWVKIYNGRKFILKQITDNMIGYKFGQFSFTRSKYEYKKKKKKK